MAARGYEKMSRAELLREVARLRALVAGDERLAGVIQELETHREELRQQQAQLIEAQRSLEASRDRYADLFDFAPIGYALLDPLGVILDINLAGAKLLGAERARVIGYPFHGFTADRRMLMDYLGRCARSREPFEAEVTLRARTDRWIPAHLTTKRLVSDSSQAAAFHMAIVDLSERKRAEAERRRAEEDQRRVREEERILRAASEAKDRFIAALSHELRTPLTPIVLALAVLERTGGVPPTLAPTLDMIRRNVHLEARLIDDLLDVSRVTQGKLSLVLQTVDVHAIVEEAVNLCAEEVRAAELRVSLELSAPAHCVRGDETRLRQVVWNLLRNAVRHTPAGGLITLASTNQTPERLTLVVSDTGAGIPPDLLERMFRPFEQGAEVAGRRGGLGLGLAICKGIIDSHGGRIAAASEGPGKGARFSVELATAQPPPAAIPAPRRPARAAPVHKRVLLVEDDPDNAAATAELLRMQGYHVRVATSVESALTAAATRFDVIVSDIGLPDGSGRDLIRRLASHGPVRSIALSGFGTDEDRRRNREAGFSRHLTKPVDPDELIAAISELIAPSPMAAAGSGRSLRSR